MRQHCDLYSLLHKWFRSWLPFLFVLLLSGCLSDEESERPVPIIAPVDISGVWVGTWSGYDPDWGRYISGNWEAELNQSGFSVSGSGVLTGDVDCTDGLMSGSLSKQYTISGEIVREPCGTNEWLITSLTLLNRQVSGVWTKSSVGSEGGFTGIQVATPDSPRIRYFHPPGGLPGTVVAVTGERFANDPADNRLDFNGTLATTLQVRDEQRIIAKVPINATIGPLNLADTSGLTTETGRSVLSFNTAVSHPTPESINSEIDLGEYGLKGIAITPDGRRAFVISSYSVTMLDVASSEVIGYGAYTNYPAQAIVASPDNRFIYVSTTDEVLILNAGLNEIIDRIPVSAGDTLNHNPHGLAMTPDGKSLLVADNRLGGSVSIVNIEDKTVARSLSLGTTATPYGIAISPDGLFAYIAAHELNQVKKFNLETYSVDNTYAVGSQPTGLVIHPDGSRLYVSNTADGTVSIIDLASETVLSTVTVGAGAKGVAVSPDGERIYTADYGSNSVSIIDTTTDTLFASLPGVNAPISVSILPDGLRGYIANDSSSTLKQIGGPTTLTILKYSSGSGMVTSWPEGIACGEKCRAEFTFNTDVTLTATADSSSTFSGWGGDCAGTDESITVTMDSIKNCTANFTSNYVSYSDSNDYYYDDYRTDTRCFIATAAYGSYLDPHVEALRIFRDQYLLTNATGSRFVEWYYDNSPPMAEFISQHEGLRLLVRLLLTPVIYGVMYPVAALLLLTGIASLLLWIRKHT